MEDEISFVKLASKVSWPELDEDGKVLMKEFLDASQLILTFFDTLGKVYTPIRQDVEGNIKKLSTKYAENPSEYKYIHDLIVLELENGESFATTALLWLKRGLHFVCLFLQTLVADDERNVTDESILENIRMSYDLALRPHHNWMLQKLFMVVSRVAPTRSTLFQSMTKNAEDTDRKEIIRQIKRFSDGLKVNVESIFNLYLQLKLDTYHFEPLPVK